MDVFEVVSEDSVVGDLSGDDVVVFVFFVAHLLLDVIVVQGAAGVELPAMSAGSRAGLRLPSSGSTLTHWSLIL